MVTETRAYDDWVIVYNGKVADADFITPFDLMAIISEIGYIEHGGEHALLDRDLSYLKKVLLVNDLFKEAMDAVFAVKFDNISKDKDRVKRDGSIFGGFEKMWQAYMT